jgi:predicted metal-binding membrane protein
MMLWSKSAFLSAAVLIGAGAYQLSPLKRACLKQCRGPAEFLTRHWRAGRVGAFVLGFEHALWCVGCCWMLMVLLFVGGVMNLAWIALLALLVFAETVVTGGATMSRITGIVLVIWGLVTLGM